MGLIFGGTKTLRVELSLAGSVQPYVVLSALHQASRKAAISNFRANSSSILQVASNPLIKYTHFYYPVRTVFASASLIQSCLSYGR